MNEGETPLEIGDVAGERRQHTIGITPGWLDFNDIRTEIGEPTACV
jgi:hypothetical protein